MTMSRTARLKPPQQARSIRSQARILRAAEELFAEKGFQDTRIEDLIARADVSVGTFYHRFPSKHAVFEYMFESYEQEVLRAAEAWDFSIARHGSLPAVLLAFAEAAVTFNSGRAGLRRAILDLTSSDPDWAARVSVLTRLFCDKLAASGEDYATEIGATDREAALRRCAQLIQMLTAQTVRRRKRLYFPSSADDFSIMLRDACLGIVRYRGPVC